VIENNNDSTTVLLSNLQKNATIKADVFDLKIPKGVKEIKA
jgi:outer membrane lipoprotein-sorting protein